MDYIMDEKTIELLNKIGIQFTLLQQLDGQIIDRDILLSDDKYDEIKDTLYNFKTIYSSSLMTSLQKNADKEQQWPLLNLVRQILNQYSYGMEPIRKSAGYTLDGIKKYKRYFRIYKKQKQQ